MLSLMARWRAARPRSMPCRASSVASFIDDLGSAPRLLVQPEDVSPPIRGSCEARLLLGAAIGHARAELRSSARESLQAKGLGARDARLGALDRHHLDRARHLDGGDAE